MPAEIKDIVGKLPRSVINALEDTKSRLASFGTEDFINDELGMPSSYLLKSPGKLVRSTLIFLGAMLVGDKPNNFIDMAVSAELLHTASLIHDDMIDKDITRRGKKAVHIQYNSETALLSGDALLLKAVGILSRYGDKVVSSVSGTALEICAGEMLDYKFQSERKVPDLNEYKRIIDLKCASAFGSSCKIAALYLNSNYTGGLEAFGRNLGMAFQIKDDIADAVQEGDNSDAQNFRPNVIKTIEAHMSMNRVNAVSMASEMNWDYIKKAKEALSEIGDSGIVSDYADFLKVDLEIENS